MGYIENERMCRVDFFKPSGKWYTTKAVEFSDEDYDGAPIHDALKNAIRRGGGADRLEGFTAVCLEPYHQYAHPLMIVWEG